MKKTAYLAALATLLFLVSCSKDEIEDTATVNIAGEWYVTLDCIATDGSSLGDMFGMGSFHVFTYNTSDNSTTQMWISDEGISDEDKFRGFRSKTDLDYLAKTFACTEAEDYLYDDPAECLVTIWDGKIIDGVATTPSGMPADSITFDISFSPAYGYYDHFRISGYRYTGFAADE